MLIILEYLELFHVVVNQSCSCRQKDLKEQKEIQCTWCSPHYCCHFPNEQLDTPGASVICLISLALYNFKNLKFILCCMMWSCRHPFWLVIWSVATCSFTKWPRWSLHLFCFSEYSVVRKMGHIHVMLSFLTLFDKLFPTMQACTVLKLKSTVAFSHPKPSVSQIADI